MATTPTESEPSSGNEESLDQLMALAISLGIPVHDGVSREELLYAIHKAQGGDGGLSI
ncbi:hypothetical protein [Oligoflexus tunisiensis]|uniref:hypothetical protein n=1 Tax=Oligoflexus tunisiensis TaxID=708132 RepID=UPI00159F2094|nr:hypothetical protein [Oligoflexus tunisiensis]